MQDVFYEFTADQSSEYESREMLVQEIHRIRDEFNEDEMEAPTKVAGVLLVATRIEMLDLNREDRIHDRQLYVLEEGGWTSKTLVP